AVVCQVRAGLPDEPEGRPGVAAMTAEALTRGTASHSSREAFNQAVVNAGGDLRAQSGFDFTEVSAVTDRGRWEAAVRLVADVIAHPSFAPETLDDSRTAVQRRG